MEVILLAVNTKNHYAERQISLSAVCCTSCGSRGKMDYAEIIIWVTSRPVLQITTAITLSLMSRFVSSLSFCCNVLGMIQQFQFVLSFDIVIIR